jgi:hypothetical protein
MHRDEQRYQQNERRPGPTNHDGIVSLWLRLRNL